MHPYRQREGIGQALIARVLDQSDGCDYLSVSFGYTRELWRFWQRAGFKLVRAGSYREASSGCYTAMALLPLTESGRALVEAEQRRLARDLPWLAPWRDEALDLPPDADQGLSDDDWQELAGFAFAHRPLSASTGALQRLLIACDLPLEALRAQLAAGLDETQISVRLHLHGRKALLAAQRQQTAAALASLDASRSNALKDHITSLQFF